MRIAIIGGTGLYDPKMLSDVRRETLTTPYGDVSLRVGRYGGEDIVFLARHGETHSIPPHRINYRANIWALKKMGIERIIATAAVGSLNLNMRPGCFVFVDQFMDFTRSRPFTFFEGGDQGVFHTDFTEPYCPEIRSIMSQVASESGIPSHNGGVYVCTEGPRFETPAEIRAYARLGGDVVGMTSVPEVVLAHEAGICYGLAAVVTNMGAGISPSALTHEETSSLMAQVSDTLKGFIIKVLERLPFDRNCNCSRTAGPLKI